LHTDKKQCKALKLNKKQCTRSITKNCEYCWQHRFSRLNEARWYNNFKIQAIIATIGTTVTIFAFLFGIYIWKTGPTKENQEITLAKIDILLAKSDIDEKIKGAVEKIFLTILQQKDIPQWQWPEKLQEIAKRHQELLDKWQTIQSGDSEVDTLRQQARQMIELGDYDNADHLLQRAFEIDRNAIQSQQKKLDKRKLSMSQSLESRADIATIKLAYKKAIELYKEAINSLPYNEQTLRASYMHKLAFLYLTIANYKEAEPLMKQVVEIFEKAYGKDHPYVALAINNLAQLLIST
jgi:tetratricopeptide (TPR) repeat protein